ncbi:MFS transporter, AAHS family, benzoate transport protein [Alteribacillus persepolensis]|uniref:MFS transporter, AAHS family, benzoate transport protein n=1 Tax=Alteribacillus persepolensis TaxID=568899 RepID=A0A1G8KI06_9BACI|nr:aromatic acid/H+ symport family MFS transporter [Alteribacillus persepolensis]SDI43034.1 MFS transporter, AAHS family, benzoate transport protein [Alteribacillus persepolensis]
MSATNLSEVVGRSKFSKLHTSILLWCVIIILVDGYDITMFGTSLPRLMEDWNLTAVQAGTIGSYGPLGMLIGSLILGPLADKFGRKSMIITCVILFSLFTLLCGLAPNPAVFAGFRFIAGLGMGGLMPNVLAYISEYAPKKLKGTLPTLVLIGVPVGNMLAAGAGIVLIPEFGWRSIYISGGVCLLLIPFLMKQLPESPRFLLARKKNDELYNVLQKIDPSIKREEVDSLTIEKAKKQSIDVKGLFQEGRAFSTVMFWVALFLTTVVTWGLNTWLAEFMVQAGYPLTSSLMFMMVYFGGAIVGTILGAWLAARIGLKMTTVSLYLVGAATLMMLVLQPGAILFYTLIFLAGIGTIGPQSAAFSFVTNYYPEKIRSTGVGIALGFNKIGGFFGPIYGSMLVTLNLSLEGNFLAFAIPCVLTGVLLFMVRTKIHTKAENIPSQSSKASV